MKLIHSNAEYQKEHRNIKGYEDTSLPKRYPCMLRFTPSGGAKGYIPEVTYLPEGIMNPQTLDPTEAFWCGVKANWEKVN